MLALRLVLSRTAQPFGERAAVLVSQPALASSPGRAGWAARRRVRGERVAQHRHQPGRRCLPIAELGAVLGGHDREHPADQPRIHSLEQPSSLGGSERRARGQVKDQLDPGIGSVHALPAGSACPGEPPPQFGLRYRDRPTDGKHLAHMLQHARLEFPARIMLASPDVVMGVMGLADPCSPANVVTPSKVSLMEATLTASISISVADNR